MRVNLFILSLCFSLFLSPMVTVNAHAEAAPEDDFVFFELKAVGKTQPSVKFINESEFKFRTKGGAQTNPPEGEPEDPPEGEEPQEEKKEPTYQDKLDKVNGTLETVNNGLDTADKIINTGEKVVKLVQGNQAVINSNLKHFNAIPQGITDWRTLNGWTRVPSTVSYEFRATRYWGFKEVAKVNFTVMFNYGGRLNGKGRYLTNVSVQPTHIYVASGYSLDVKCEVPDESVVNVAEDGQDPIASLTLKFTWKLSGSYATEDTALFSLDGEGNFTELKVSDEVKQVKKNITPARSKGPQLTRLSPERTDSNIRKEFTRLAK